jgi:hypothetical protein
MQRYTVYFIWELLYMFRMLPPPIIRSAKTVSAASGIDIDVFIYLLTAVGLSPGGSTHLHTNNTQNYTNNNRTTQIGRTS